MSRQANPSPPGPMQQWILAQGFTYMGNCGCRANMSRWHSADPVYHGYEIWTDSQFTKFQVRRFYGGTVDSKIIGIGNANNYVTIFEHWMPKKP